MTAFHHPVLPGAVAEHRDDPAGRGGCTEGRRGAPVNHLAERKSDMIGFAKIIGDLIGGYIVHIAGGIGAILLASEAAGVFTSAMAPVANVLN